MLALFEFDESEGEKFWKENARNGEREMFVLQVKNTFQRFTFTVLKDWNNSRPADQHVFNSIVFCPFFKVAQ